ncbi:hypothetical protein A2875_01665 [Candidatus Gottesmanbacteria bacterium RIFCSPHIGHO2_01_FULL_46_14]|uniref:UDP-N-acetylmuramyl-tripeptide synthetase n=2 Tax=Candidatus Gottesmaniibacteriota TaxID=1752720 RepID=A0A1F5ZMH1_9BACT|nr:MAG: hypothetical protein A2875_01665 [Candidatus Gottesmanbacteria bacterium RIFCSPHIGHO2_01_FULL_46_14]OGG28835.1 MAG: hypothetical protein A2971_02770 [Candidatus Gottesmanbacteria bacterium RIFCSPLOWO2_01_FULL_46_21]
MIRGAKGLYHLLEAIVANIWFGFPGRSLTVIGVTGTDGKTTTTTLIYEILKAAGKNVSMITSVAAVIAGKSYDTGFHVTNPRAWWLQKYLREVVDHGDTHMVLEVTSHGLSQYRVWGIPFAVGVLTNVTHEHLDWHGTMESYTKTKLSLLKQSKTAIASKIKLPGKKVIAYDKLRFQFQTRLLGEFNRQNCLAAIAAARELGVDDAVIQKAIADYAGVPGRLETVVTKPFGVIVDFAHTPNAIEQVLRTVRPFTKNRLIHVFGSAALRDHSKRPFMGTASARYADIIILTEEDYRTEDVDEIINQIASGMPKEKKVHKIPDRKKAIEFALSIARPGDLVILTGKGHEKSLARGNKEYPWSDQEAVKEFFKH